MKALVVYESLFGNTRAVAEAVVVGLSRTHDAEAVDAAAADVAAIAACDLLVVGAPTHGHNLPSAATRATGRRGTGEAGSVAAATGVRELLPRLPDGAGREAAAFDTSLRGPRWLWGAASRVIARVKSPGVV